MENIRPAPSSSLSDFDPSAGQAQSDEPPGPPLLLEGGRASRDSPLSLLLSENADLDKKMLLVSFFLSAGADLQTGS